MASPLTNKWVLITGASSGFGAAAAQRFAQEGARLLLGARRTDRLEQTVAQARKAGSPAAHFSALDVCRTNSVADFVKWVRTHTDKLDVLVNNAGGAPPADAATASPRFAEAIIRLNLIAPLNFAQRANAVMQAQPDGGAIINIASVSGIRPSPGTAAYGAAKAGLLNLTQTLAVEWAPKVRVNAVAGGMIRTEQAHLHYGDEAGIAAVTATVPLGRLGEPRDVGDACLFLASRLASYVSGAVLVLHGGGERPAFLAAAAKKND
jgi:NAD(P)-dependent dehydrogenase (short-subunit alcohol dehydrogenase family)